MAAPTSNSEQQLAWEARHRNRAGVAAIIGAIGLFFYFVLGQLIARDAPSGGNALDTFARVGKDGSIADMRSLSIPYWEYVDSKSTMYLIMGVFALIGFLGLGWAAGFLAVATRARVDTLRRWHIYLPIIGGVVLALSLLLLQISQAIRVSDFLDGPQSVRTALKVESGATAYARLLGFLGALVLALGLILVSLNAMRAGLLTKFYGYVGVVAGAMLVICPLAIVHTVWLGGLGLLFLGRWPGGDLPAWKTGNAEPWPVPERPARGVPAVPETSAGPAAPTARRKRKKRN